MMVITCEKVKKFDISQFERETRPGVQQCQAQGLVFYP